MRKIAVFLSVLLLYACGAPTVEPFMEPDGNQRVYPDYADVTVPPNIAPLNFDILGEGKGYATVFSHGSETYVCKGKKVRIPVRKWHGLLSSAAGGDLTVSIRERSGSGWADYDSFVIHVASDPIDEYVAYRLIEPGYVHYGEMMLRQRNLTNFKESDIYNNSLMSRRLEQQCINCHAFQANGTERMQFHVRQLSGGTVIADGDEIGKLNFKTDSLIGNGVYPSWHPTEDLLAYSVNVTNQVFLRNDRHRLEVYDSASDLILYDPRAEETRFILHEPDRLETFPAWAPDGKTLYYAVADLAPLGLEPGQPVYEKYEFVRYAIGALPFDPVSRTFGTPSVVFDAPADSLSAVTPRPSPDGRFLLCAVGKYGCFQIWHDEGDLYLVDLATGNIRPLEEANSDRADSFHSWSSNSRWFVFASRREDRTYSRLYISYLDENGRAGKPFLLPQKDPSVNRFLMKSFNVPELTKEKVRTGAKSFARAVGRDAGQATFVSSGI